MHVNTEQVTAAFSKGAFDSPAGRIFFSLTGRLAKALLRYWRILWTPWSTMSWGGKVMGQYLRFKPVSVITFPARKEKQNKVMQIKQSFLVDNCIDTVHQPKGRVIIKVFVDNFNGRIQSVGCTTSEAMQLLAKNDL